MSASSDDVEARIRAALNGRLGEAGRVSRFHRHNDMIYLEVVASLGLERTAKAVEQALESISSFLRAAKTGIDVTISSPWSPRWQSQATAHGQGDSEQSNDEPGLAAVPNGRRAVR